MHNQHVVTYKSFKYWLAMQHKMPLSPMVYYAELMQEKFGIDWRF
jgi:hypothetical protein